MGLVEQCSHPWSVPRPPRRVPRSHRPPTSLRMPCQCQRTWPGFLKRHRACSNTRPSRDSAIAFISPPLMGRAIEGVRGFEVGKTTLAGAGGGEPSSRAAGSTDVPRKYLAESVSLLPVCCASYCLRLPSPITYGTGARFLQKLFNRRSGFNADGVRTFGRLRATRTVRRFGSLRYGAAAARS